MFNIIELDTFLTKNKLMTKKRLHKVCCLCHLLSTPQSDDENTFGISSGKETHEET